MLGFRRRPDPQAENARRLYDALTARARAPVFYTRFCVPDTIDGRFDMVALHASLLMDALKREGEAGREVGTHLATQIFAGFDIALRDLGVSDMGLSRRIRALADAFYGRLDAYRTAESPEDLAAALSRNLYRGDATRGGEARALADYVAGVRAALASGEAGPTLLRGAVDFGPLPA